MTATFLYSGDASNGASITNGNDGTMVVQVGPNGAKVNALSLSVAGIPTFNQLTQSLSANGYKKLDGGLIIQWGTASTSASSSVVVTYPIAFSAAAFVTLATARTGASNARVTSTDAGSSTQFTIFTDISSTITCAWIALGY